MATTATTSGSRSMDRRRTKGSSQRITLARSLCPSMPTPGGRMAWRMVRSGPTA